MKKFIITGFALTAFTFSVIGQVAHDYNPYDREAIVNTTITKDQVPAAVQKAVNTQFKLDNPITWCKFPYALKEYGWVYDVGASDIQLDHFQVTMKTDNGNELQAIYTSDGNLVETREMSTNVPIPADIMAEFQNSQYKDWRIVGNREIIRFYHDYNNVNSVEQHFRITVEKDNVRRSISFNYQKTANK